MTIPYQKTKSTDSVLAPLRVEDPSVALRVRRGILSLGYHGDAVKAAIAEARSAGAGQDDYAAIAERLPPVSPLACLIRAFVLRAPTAEEEMRRLLGEEFFAECETAGLWERVEGGIVGSAVVMVDGKTFLLSDHGATRLGELAMHWVMGIGTSTMKLAHSVARRPYARVLDLCCGAGIHAFMTSPLATEVVAVDRNPRALNYGRFGAGMSKFGNISFRESDCYSAVQGEQFDAIICNPPYVLTPDRQTYYRDGGMGGDRFAETILRAAPGYLNENGHAHVMCDVAAMEGKSSGERLRGWMDGSGCDVLAIAAPPVDAAAYARNWLSKENVQSEEKRWADNLRELGITSVANLLVVLRKRTDGGPNWFRLATFDGDPRGYFGHQIARLFACEDLLREGNGAIETAQLRVPADVRLVHTVRADGGRWVAESSAIRFAEGLQQESPIDGRTANALANFDGKQTLEKVQSSMGGFPRMSAVRDLLARGFLEPVSR